MPKVKNIVTYIEKLAPKTLAMPWDNVGLMVGDMDAQVKNVYIALDLTSENIQEAISNNADLIISHHPLIFPSINRVIEQDVTGSMIISLLKSDISVYSAHTNFDVTEGGMNDILSEKLGLSNIRSYLDEECTDPSGKTLENIGRIGKLDTPIEMADFVDYVKNVLGCAAISYVGDPSEIVANVAVCSGSGGDLIYNAYNAGADVYVTSEVKHHEAQLALELGINLVDAGHFETENIICDFMEEYLENEFDDINISKSTSSPYKKR